MIGYSVSATARVRIRDLGKANATLDAAAASVGNDIVFNGIQLTART